MDEICIFIRTLFSTGRVACFLVSCTFYAAIYLPRSAGLTRGLGFLARSRLRFLLRFIFPRPLNVYLNDRSSSSCRPAGRLVISSRGIACLMKFVRSFLLHALNCCTKVSDRVHDEFFNAKFVDILSMTEITTDLKIEVPT